MQCPKCSGKSSVTRTQKHSSGHVRRYRKCSDCGHTFITAQTATQAEHISNPLPPVAGKTNIFSCPVCGEGSRIVSMTRKHPNEIRRYRKCQSCSHSFITSQPLEKVIEAQPFPSSMKGQANPTAKLTDTTVKELRAFAATGASSFEAGLAFGIDQKNAWRAINRKTWAHVK